ncbi:SDR family oxidoreductase [Pseudodonghicola flavimaris]|uniref:SDR family oxidoreductase n=1 Tax=Pseudodonghicola flavimaris TaxID=3050036 RepID=A0ABT7EZE1_9RHOB|nr:SDR family oxidoreductase [Pseudodonghicola flavimaris]MDK3017715.1 SDR family oxidoreductase [Pseudodonghicola flavimaris]
MNMTGRTVLITGASRGIGAEAGRIFADAGANVVLMARSADAVAALAAEIGPKAVAVSGDVSRFADMEAAVARAVADFGGLDVLIGNAGVIDPIAPLAEADPEAWGRLIDINLKGVFNGMRAALPVMRGAGGGTILTISSGAAHRPLEGWSAYCASKAGAAMLTSALHLEEAGNGIRAMGLSPGTVATQMQREIKASGVNPVSQLDWEDHIPADWPARTLLWMCSEAAEDLVGQEVSLRDPAIRQKVGLI